MKQFYGYFLKVRRELKVILVLAIVTYFSIELWFNNYPELFYRANKIGQFFSKLAISYMSAFIFYFVVVHIKNEKDKQNINEFVGHEVYQIITCAHLLIQPFQQKFDEKARFRYMDAFELQELLTSVDRTAEEAPYRVKGQITSWLSWYEYLKDGSQKHLQKILTRYNHLDTNLIKQLARIENSLFFLQFNMLYDFSHDKSFGIYKFQIETYLALIKELEEYADKNLKQYRHLTSGFMGKR